MDAGLETHGHVLLSVNTRVYPRVLLRVQKAGTKPRREEIRSAYVIVQLSLRGLSSKKKVFIWYQGAKAETRRIPRQTIAFGMSEAADASFRLSYRVEVPCVGTGRWFSNIKFY